MRLYPATSKIVSPTNGCGRQGLAVRLTTHPLVQGDEECCLSLLPPTFLDQGQLACRSQAHHANAPCHALAHPPAVGAGASDELGRSGRGPGSPGEVPSINGRGAGPAPKPRRRGKSSTLAPRRGMLLRVRAPWKRVAPNCREVWPCWELDLSNCCWCWRLAAARRAHPWACRRSPPTRRSSEPCPRSACCWPIRPAPRSPTRKARIRPSSYWPSRRSKSFCGQLGQQIIGTSAIRLPRQSATRPLAKFGLPIANLLLTRPAAFYVSHLAIQPGGPPDLRIALIVHCGPQDGRPEEMARRLGKACRPARAPPVDQIKKTKAGGISCGSCPCPAGSKWIGASKMIISS